MTWRHAWLYLALLIGAQVPARAAGPDLQPYRVGDWPAVVARHQGKPFIVHLWGITCGPCIAELPRWGKFVEAHPGLPVVFIEMDQAPVQVVMRYVSDSRLSRSENKVLVDPFDEYARYEIDPQWRGELPLTLMFNAAGQARRVAGEVDFGDIEVWWRTGRAPVPR